MTTIFPNNCSPESITSFTKEIETVKLGQGSKVDRVAKAFWAVGLVSVIAGVTGLLVMGIGGCAMAAGFGLIGAVVAAVVVAIGLCCLVATGCLLLKRSNWYEKEQRLWIESKSRSQVLLADALETNLILQKKVEELSLENKENICSHREDVAKYEQVVQDQCMQMVTFLELQRKLSDERKALTKSLEESSRLLEEQKTEISSLKEKLSMSEAEKEEMAKEALEFEKMKQGLDSGRRASI
ncbi:inclusion membrane protein InaC [Chlamydia suis]|uniref:Inclusion membrane protein-5 n=1 Tax=Chlamydia suis TaxID=83559 RepID=A0ABX6IPT7_9CHLA|nr:hypothetical protein [Chlamydia suis]QHP83094.1 putative inclusion membrane protein-5 [Chlamydia suis]